jgi:hypothetical protein
MMTGYDIIANLALSLETSLEMAVMVFVTTLMQNITCTVHHDDDVDDDDVIFLLTQLVVLYSSVLFYTYLDMMDQILPSKAQK